MIRIAFSILLVFTLQYTWAQQPLSKRDQKLKAEFEAQIEAEEKYKELMKLADDAFRIQDYAAARNHYNDAIQYNKEQEQWLISKVNDLDILMAEIIAREVDSVLVIKSKTPKVIERSSDAPPIIEARKEEIMVDVNEPEEDSTIMEEDLAEEVVEEPIEQPEIAKKELQETNIEVRLPKTTPRVETRSAPTGQVNKQDKKEEKVVEDYSKFPQGRTDETFTFPDHTVRRVVVKDKRDVIVYKYVTHRWGGKFYFKDGVSIVERIWKQEVEEYEAKFPENLAK
ncbi:MAG: hypothetical protein Salg2KO_17320 [Salibacteraceae bacterium]